MVNNMDIAASHMEDQKPSSVKFHNVNKSILDVFSDLGKEGDTKRIEACVALVQHLSRKEDQESDENANRDLTYCLKRLIRGLGATRQTVQKGFFAALVGILETVPSVTCSTFFEIVDKELGCGKNASKGEEGEAMMGQVLAYGATIRGGLFEKSSSDQQKHIITTLMSCGKKRSYLPYASSSFMYDLILKSDEKLLVDNLWPIVKEEVSKPWEDQSLDTLLLLLSVTNRVPTIVKTKTIQKWLGFPLLSSHSMQHFAQKLVGSSTALTLKHPLFDEFCRVLSLPNNNELLENFWSVQVDGLLVSPSKNKDHAVIHILILLLKSVSNKQQVDVLVTPRTLDVIGRTLSGSLTKKQRHQELDVQAREVITSLGSVLSSEDVSDKTRLSVLRKIYFASGNLQFEKRTGTHISILLESKLSSKGVQKLVKQFKEVVKGTSQNTNQVWTNRDRKFAAQQLSRLIGHPACSSDIQWKVEQLLFLLHHGLFRENSGSFTGVELAASLRQCFFRALDQKFLNLETMIEVLSKIGKQLDESLSHQEELDKTFMISFSEQVLTSWRRMMKTVSHLEKKIASNGSKGSAEQIFHALFLFMGLQLLSDPDMAHGALQELHSCYERVKSGKQGTGNAEEPQWVEVTIDLFLSLLSHDSHLLRTIVGTVFPYLSKHLTVSSFCQIMEVLDPSQNENPLTSAKESDDSSESDSDGEENSSSKRSKLTNGNEKHPNEENSDAGDSSESEDEESVEEESEDENDDLSVEDETVNDKLRQEVRLALGNAASLTDTESVDLDDIDDEEGHRMDMALAQAFKTLRQSRTNRSKKQLKSEEALTHFRIRVLGLVESYFSREPSMDLCLESITPLLSLLAFCMKDIHQKPLETRIRGILRKLTSIKKFSSLDGVDEESIADQVKTLAERGVRSATTFLGLSDLIAECCTFLVRCSEYLRTHSSKKKKALKQNPVAKVYESLLVDFFTRRDTLLPINMFRSVLNLQWSGCWCLAPLIVLKAFDLNLRPFRRGQAIDLLLVFFRNNHLLNSADEKEKQSLKEIVASIMDRTVELLSSSDCGSQKTHVRQKARYIGDVIRLVSLILSRPEIKPADTSAVSTALQSFCESSDGVTGETKKVLTSLSKQLGCTIGSLRRVKNTKKTNSLLSKDISSSDEEDEEELSASKRKINRNENKTNGPVGSEMDGSAGQFKSHNGIKETKVISRKTKKLQRMALMGEGLESVNFSSLNQEVLNGVEPMYDESIDGSYNKGNVNVNGYLNDNGKKLSKRKKSSNNSLDSQVSTKKVRIQ